MPSANPATNPASSRTGSAVTAATTPEVPIETITSPSSAPRPSAAAALSPRPAPNIFVPLGVLVCDGPSTVGSSGRRPRRASSSRSKRYWPLAAS